jgi:hypothetical protein
MNKAHGLCTTQKNQNRTFVYNHLKINGLYWIHENNGEDVSLSEQNCDNKRQIKYQLVSLPSYRRNTISIYNPA